MAEHHPTPWEEINPPMALAPPQGLASPSLVPASKEQFRNELTACLALVVPVGMTEEARRDWLAVAWATVGHLPPDMLTEGCEAARRTADHPSKIVPAIIAATDGWMETRRRLNQYQPQPQQFVPLLKDETDRPLTLDELRGMSPFLIGLARRNNLAEPETFAAFDREMDAKQCPA